MVSKVHVANRRQRAPPRRRGGGGEGATESDSCGWGQREGPGAGRVREPARVPLSFGTKESLSLRHLSLPGGPRKPSAWGRQPEESLCASGPSGRPSVSRASRGKSAQSPGEGAANMESGLKAEGGGGGAEVGAQPPPLPLRAEFGAQSRARRLGQPRAPKSQPAASSGGRGWEPNFFLPREQTREFSFFQSLCPTGFAGPRGGWSAESDAEWGSEGCRRPECRPVPSRPGSHVLRLGLGRGGGCALCVNCWECSASARTGGVSSRAGTVVRKFVREWLLVGFVECIGGCTGCVSRGCCYFRPVRVRTDG